MADADQPYFSVQIEGVETLATVERVEVEDDDRLIDKALVVFDDPAGVATATMLEQRRIVIELGWDSERARVFEGLVWRVKARAGISPRHPGKRKVTLEALDLSYLMHQGASKPKAHPHGKLSDIVTALVSTYPIPVGQIKLDNDPEFTEDAPLIQGPMTDWAFLQELAVRFGARAYVEINDDASQFYFISESALVGGDPVGGLTFTVGDGPLIEFTCHRMASAASPIRAAAVVDPQTGEVQDQQAADPDPEDPITVDSEQKSRLDQIGDGSGDVYANAINVMSQAAGKAEDARARETLDGAPSDPDLAQQMTLQDTTRKYGLIGKGVAVGNVNFRAKSLMTINGVAPWADGDWYLRRVRHCITRGDARGSYRTHFVATR
jgi:hypothetical protein